MRYPTRVRVLHTEVDITVPLTQEEAAVSPSVAKRYIAIWDTGATGTVITNKVATDLGLQVTGIVEVSHAAGKSNTNTYLVNVGLPNGVMISGVKVTEGILANEVEVLIGMDIIGAGDFAVTHCNNNGGTTMSFCIPSSEEIDFVPRSAHDKIMKTGNREQRRALRTSKK